MDVGMNDYFGFLFGVVITGNVTVTLNPDDPDTTDKIDALNGPGAFTVFYLCGISSTCVFLWAMYIFWKLSLSRASCSPGSESSACFGLPLSITTDFVARAIQS